MSDMAHEDDGFVHDDEIDVADYCVEVKCQGCWDPRVTVLDIEWWARTFEGLAWSVECQDAIDRAGPGGVPTEELWPLVREQAVVVPQADITVCMQRLPADLWSSDVFALWTADQVVRYLTGVRARRWPAGSVWSMVVLYIQIMAHRNDRRFVDEHEAVRSIHKVLVGLSTDDDSALAELVRVIEDVVGGEVDGVTCTIAGSQA